MTRKMVALDVALIAMAIVLGWQIRVRWLEGIARERAIFTNAVRPKTLLPPPPLETPKQVMALEYIDVAQKMLFSKDRNPNVVIEPPAPKPKPPVPPMPEYYGQMAIGDPVVLLSDGPNGQKSFRVGDKAGPFEIAAFDSETITFLWNDEKLVRNLEELRPKGKPAQATGAVAARPAVQASASAAPALKSIGGASDSQPSDDKNPMGVATGGGYFSCKPGDTTPNGTVVNGYKKVVSRGLMGETCGWQAVK